MAKGTFTNPFSPFNIFGALATTGAQGARGAYEGIFGGEEARRRFLAEDEANRIRALQGILLGKQVENYGQPTYSFHGDRQVMQVPGKAPVVTELPMTESEKKLAEERAAQARKAERESAPTEAQAKGKIITEYLQRLQTDGPLKAQEWLDSTLKKIHEAESKGAAGDKGFTLAPGGRRYDATGKLIAEAPPRPRGEGGESTSTTESFKLTPRKPIATDSPTYGGIQRALPDVVNEITGAFQKQGLNFNVPGAYVRLPSGKLVRKEDVIAQALLERFGVETAIRWEGEPQSKGMFGQQIGGRFALTKAWEPAQREPTTTTTTKTKGRPASRPAAGEDDEE